MSDFKTEREVIDFYRGLTKAFEFDMLPHMVMSHGYMAWYTLLFHTFPSLSANGIEDMEKEFNHFCNVLFEDIDLTEEQKKYLRVEGWKQYLDD